MQYHMIVMGAEQYILGVTLIFRHESDGVYYQETHIVTVMP